MNDGTVQAADKKVGNAVDDARANMRDVRDYLNGLWWEVEGWCRQQNWQNIQAVDEVQRKLGVTGPIGEIGVYHGKFFIGLMKTKRERPNFAIDLFGQQQFNLDGSGTGNLDQFRRNLERAGESLDDVRIVERDSLSLTRREVDAIREETGGFSLFSVDGGHDVDHVINDVRIAMELTRPGGVIYVDDYYNSNWPGVHEGVCKLYLTSTPRFVPLVFSCNKLALCHISYHPEFVEHVADFITTHFSDTAFKRVRHFGYDSLAALPDFENGDFCVDR